MEKRYDCELLERKLQFYKRAAEGLITLTVIEARGASDGALQGVIEVPYHSAFTAEEALEGSRMLINPDANDGIVRTVRLVDEMEARIMHAIIEQQLMNPPSI